MFKTKQTHLVLYYLCLVFCVPWVSELRGAENESVRFMKIWEKIELETDKFDYELEAYVNFFPLQPLGGSEDDEIEVLNKLTLDRQIDVSDDSVLDLKIGIVASSVSKAESGVLSEPLNKSSQGRYLDIENLKYTYFSEDFDLIAGKAPVEMGLSEIISATNVFGASNTSHPLHPYEIGKWQVGSEYFIEDDSIRFIILPIDDAHGGPPKGSRWNSDGNSSTGTTFPGLSLPSNAEINNSYRDNRISNWGFLAKYNGTKPGLDYFLGFYKGPGAFAVLASPVTSGSKQKYQQLRPMSSMLFGGFAKTQEAWKFYGEMMLQNSHNGVDDDIGRYNLGLKYRETNYANKIGIEEIAPILEVTDEFVIKGFDNNDIYASSASSRGNPHNIIGAVEIIIDSKNSLRFSTNYNLKDKDHSAVIVYEFKPNDNLSFGATFYDFGGESNTHFGSYRRNTNFEFGVKTKF